MRKVVSLVAAFAFISGIAMAEDKKVEKKFECLKAGKVIALKGKTADEQKKECDVAKGEWKEIVPAPAKK